MLVVVEPHAPAPELLAKLEVERERILSYGPVFVGIEPFSEKRKTRLTSTAIRGMRFAG